MLSMEQSIQNKKQTQELFTYFLDTSNHSFYYEKIWLSDHSIMPTFIKTLTHLVKRQGMISLILIQSVINV